MLLMRIYYRVRGDHVHLRVFVGADPNTLAFAGTLGMRASEFMQLAQGQFMPQYVDEEDHPNV
jgi:hypothetical protein